MDRVLRLLAAWGPRLVNCLVAHSLLLTLCPTSSTSKLVYKVPRNHPPLANLRIDHLLHARLKADDVTHVSASCPHVPYSLSSCHLLRDSPSPVYRQRANDVAERLEGCHGAVEGSREQRRSCRRGKSGSSWTSRSLAPWMYNRDWLRGNQWVKHPAPTSRTPPATPMAHPCPAPAVIHYAPSSARGAACPLLRTQHTPPTDPALRPPPASRKRHARPTAPLATNPSSLVASCQLPVSPPSRPPPPALRARARHTPPAPRDTLFPLTAARHPRPLLTTAPATRALLTPATCLPPPAARRPLHMPHRPLNVHTPRRALLMPATRPRVSHRTRARCPMPDARRPLPDARRSPLSACRAGFPPLPVVRCSLSAAHVTVSRLLSLAARYLSQPLPLPAGGCLHAHASQKTRWPLPGKRDPAFCCVLRKSLARHTPVTRTLPAAHCLRPPFPAFRCLPPPSPFRCLPPPSPAPAPAAHIHDDRSRYALLAATFPAARWLQVAAPRFPPHARHSPPAARRCRLLHVVNTDMDPRSPPNDACLLQAASCPMSLPPPLRPARRHATTRARHLRASFRCLPQACALPAARRSSLRLPATPCPSRLPSTLPGSRRMRTRHSPPAARHCRLLHVVNTDMDPRTPPNAERLPAAGCQLPDVSAASTPPRPPSCHHTRPPPARVVPLPATCVRVASCPPQFSPAACYPVPVAAAVRARMEAARVVQNSPYVARPAPRFPLQARSPRPPSPHTARVTCCRLSLHERTPHKTRRAPRADAVRCPPPSIRHLLPATRGSSAACSPPSAALVPMFAAPPPSAHSRRTAHGCPLAAARRPLVVVRCASPISRDTCAFMTIAPPGGVMALRDSKKQVYQHIRELYLPYTIIDPAADNDIHAGGTASTMLGDVRDIGRYVALITKDARTPNKYVAAYSDVLSENEIFALVEEMSGETIARNYISADDIVAACARFAALVESENIIRGDDTLAYAAAAYLGYLDAQELYPVVRPRIFRAFVAELLDGKAEKPYKVLPPLLQCEQFSRHNVNVFLPMESQWK
ncbi:hypothetical protein GGX14DRAFT_581485 [Mycena pura]|uniref:Uncharacterized protein n=1 Tax=Mycena pura TaxID=153505 RepID=A0AAD6YV10_9AGAR|nr:hypothetical protein GGX14DRAFT_581485 [Mycena pura]